LEVIFKKWLFFDKSLTRTSLRYKQQGNPSHSGGLVNEVF